MSHQDIRDLTRATPFIPFRVYLSNGEMHLVRHPDMIMTTLTSAHIAAPPTVTSPALDGTGAARIVSLNHVVKIETVPEHSTPGSNGST